MDLENELKVGDIVVFSEREHILLVGFIKILTINVAFSLK